MDTLHGKITLTTEKKQQLPKKIVQSKRFYLKPLEQPYSDKKNPYSVYMSVWVPDVPYSKNRPCIALTIRGRKDEYIRLIFNSMFELNKFVMDIQNWITDIFAPVQEALIKARQEWTEFQEKLSSLTNGVENDR